MKSDFRVTFCRKNFIQVVFRPAISRFQFMPPTIPPLFINGFVHLREKSKGVALPLL